MTMTDSLFLFFFESFPFFLRYISVEVEEKKKKTSKLKGNENQSIQQRIKINKTTQSQNQTKSAYNRCASMISCGMHDVVAEDEATSRATYT